VEVGGSAMLTSGRVISSLVSCFLSSMGIEGK
jgi:hypothetical protein